MQTRLHRFDVVRLERGASNCTYIATATHAGDVVLRAVANHSPAPSATFIRLRVMTGIVPSNALVHVGSRFCFRSLLDESPSVAVPGLLCALFAHAFTHSLTDLPFVRCLVLAQRRHTCI